MADLARLRQVAYRLFGLSLLCPDPARRETLVALAGELKQHRRVWSSFSFFREWDRFLDALQRLGDQAAHAVQSDYVSRFLVNPDGVPCPLYESAYLGGDPSANARLLAHLEHEYARAGLAPSPDFREPPDHASVELEFAAFLCAQEAEAWERGDLALALQTLQREHDFLRRHLCWWFPKFARGVAATIPTTVYTTTAQAAQAFLTHDADLVGALLERFEGAPEAS